VVSVPAVIIPTEPVGPVEVTAALIEMAAEARVERRRKYVVTS